MANNNYPSSNPLIGFIDDTGICRCSLDYDIKLKEEASFHVGNSIQDISSCFHPNVSHLLSFNNDDHLVFTYSYFGGQSLKLYFTEVPNVMEISMISYQILTTLGNLKLNYNYRHQNLSPYNIYFDGKVVTIDIFDLCTLLLDQYDQSHVQINGLLNYQINHKLNKKNGPFNLGIIILEIIKQDYTLHNHLSVDNINVHTILKDTKLESESKLVNFLNTCFKTDSIDEVLQSEFINVYTTNYRDNINNDWNIPEYDLYSMKYNYLHLHMNYYVSDAINNLTLLSKAVNRQSIKYYMDKNGTSKLYYIEAAVPNYNVEYYHKDLPSLFYFEQELIVTDPMVSSMVNGLDTDQIQGLISLQKAEQQSQEQPLNIKPITDNMKNPQVLSNNTDTETNSGANDIGKELNQIAASKQGKKSITSTNNLSNVNAQPTTKEKQQGQKNTNRINKLPPTKEYVKNQNITPNKKNYTSPTGNKETARQTNRIEETSTINNNGNNISLNHNLKTQKLCTPIFDRVEVRHPRTIRSNINNNQPNINNSHHSKQIFDRHRKCNIDTPYNPEENNDKIITKLTNQNINSNNNKKINNNNNNKYNNNNNKYNNNNNKYNNNNNNKTINYDNNTPTVNSFGHVDSSSPSSGGTTPLPFAPTTSETPTNMIKCCQIY